MAPDRVELQLSATMAHPNMVVSAMYDIYCLISQLAVLSLRLLAAVSQESQRSLQCGTPDGVTPSLPSNSTHRWAVVDMRRGVLGLPISLVLCAHACVCLSVSLSTHLGFHCLWTNNNQTHLANDQGCI